MRLLLGQGIMALAVVVAARSSGCSAKCLNRNWSNRCWVGCGACKYSSISSRPNDAWVGLYISMNHLINGQCVQYHRYHSLDDAALDYFYWELSSGSYHSICVTLHLSLGNVCLGTMTWNLWLGILSLVCGFLKLGEPFGKLCGGGRAGGSSPRVFKTLSKNLRGETN